MTAHITFIIQQWQEHLLPDIDKLYRTRFHQSTVVQEFVATT